MTTSRDLVEVEVHPDSETLIVAVSRDVWDDYYALPESLVVEYEAARERWRAAQDAITQHIEAHGLESQYVEVGDE